MASEGFLRSVLADGGRPFAYRGALARLLGLPPGPGEVAVRLRSVSGQALVGSMPAPPLRFSAHAERQHDAVTPATTAPTTVPTTVPPAAPASSPPPSSRSPRDQSPTAAEPVGVTIPSAIPRTPPVPPVIPPPGPPGSRRPARVPDVDGPPGRGATVGAGVSPPSLPTASAHRLSLAAQGSGDPAASQAPAAATGAAVPGAVRPTGSVAAVPAPSKGGRPRPAAPGPASTAGAPHRATAPRGPVPPGDHIPPLPDPVPGTADARTQGAGRAVASLPPPTRVAGATVPAYRVPGVRTIAESKPQAAGAPSPAPPRMPVRRPGPTVSTSPPPRTDDEDATTSRLGSPPSGDGAFPGPAAAPVPIAVVVPVAPPRRPAYWERRYLSRSRLRLLR